MRLKRQAHRERGDTIIEVMFAIVIFSFVAISSIAIMNQGIATGERALEITLVRQQINAQAEALRFIHEGRVAMPGLVTQEGSAAYTWNQFLTSPNEGYRQTRASEYGRLDANGECAIPESGRPFILNARTAQIWNGQVTAEAEDGTLPPYAQVVYDDSGNISAAYGLWIESVPSDSSIDQPFVDFHIRACWAAPGGSQPMTIGTIVRLYDPAVN